MIGALIALGITIVLAYFVMNMLPLVFRRLNIKYGFPTIFPSDLKTKNILPTRSTTLLTKYPIILINNGLLAEVKTVSRYHKEWNIVVDVFNTTDSIVSGRVSKMIVDWGNLEAINEEDHVWVLGAGEGFLSSVSIRCNHKKDPRNIIIHLTIDSKKHIISFAHENYQNLKERSNDEVLDGE